MKAPPLPIHSSLNCVSKEYWELKKRMLLCLISHPLRLSKDMSVNSRSVFKRLPDKGNNRGTGRPEMCPCLRRTCQVGHENISNPTYVVSMTEQDGGTSRQSRHLFFRHRKQVSVTPLINGRGGNKTLLTVWTHLNHSCKKVLGPLCGNKTCR